VRLIFPLQYFAKSCALILVIVILQKTQRTKATEVKWKHNARDFPEELQGNSIDHLGSGYLQLI